MPLPGQARIHTCPPVDDSGHRHCGIANDDGHHRGYGRTGWGGTGGGGTGSIYSMYETLLCIATDMGVSGDQGARRCMYVHVIAGMCGIYLLS